MAPTVTTVGVGLTACLAGLGAINGALLPRAIADRSLRPPAALAAALSSVAVVALGWLMLRTDRALGALVAHAGREGAAFVAAAYLQLMAVSVVLTMIDLETRRLPDALVLPMGVSGALLLSLGSVIDSDPTALRRAVTGAAVLFLFYTMFRFLGRGAMGGGDVKLAGVLGLHLAFAGWEFLAVATVLAFVGGGLFGSASLLSGLSRPRPQVPVTIAFGPWMAAGAWCALLSPRLDGLASFPGH